MMHIVWKADINNTWVGTLKHFDDLYRNNPSYLVYREQDLIATMKKVESGELVPRVVGAAPPPAPKQRIEFNEFPEAAKLPGKKSYADKVRFCLANFAQMPEQDREWMEDKSDYDLDGYEDKWSDGQKGAINGIYRKLSKRVQLEAF